MSSNTFVINGHYRSQQVTGVQRYALEIIKEFDEQGIDYTFVEPPPAIKSDSQRQLWMQLMMPNKIPESSLLWSPTNTGPVFYKNQVLTLHDIADQLHPEWFSPMYVNWRRIILPLLVRNARGIITVSNYSKKTIVDRYPSASGKIKVIYNGVRTDHFYPRSEEEVSTVRSQYNLNKPYVITVGSLDPRKNIDGLLKAWNLLPSSIRKENDLVIAGETADKFSFQLSEKVDASVRFLGYVDYNMLPALYSAASAFAYPSLFEGFGLPVLEAMACQTPVITSGTTSLKEIAQERAITINPESPEHICEALKKTLGTEKVGEHYIRKGYNFAQSFTWAKSAEETLTFFKRNGWIF